MFQPHALDGSPFHSSSNVIPQQRFANLLHEHIVVALESRLNVVFRFEVANAILGLQALPSTRLPAFLQPVEQSATLNRLCSLRDLTAALCMLRRETHLEGTLAMP